MALTSFHMYVVCVSVAVSSRIWRNIVDSSAFEVPDDTIHYVAFFSLVDVVEELVNTIVGDDVVVGVGQRLGIKIAWNASNDVKGNILDPLTNYTKPVLDFDDRVVAVGQTGRDVESVVLLVRAKERAGDDRTKLFGEYKLTGKFAREPGICNKLLPLF